MGRTRGRKIGPKTILTMAEEEELVNYIYLMLHWDHPMTPTQLKNKVGEITQDTITPFKDGILGQSWMRWFRVRHPKLVLRMPQGLDHKRARAVNPETVANFFGDLEALYL